MSLVRLGLIGCGRWGWRYVPAAAEAGNCVVTHVARLSVNLPLEAQAALSTSSICACVEDWRQLLDEPIDAFIVAAPPLAHAAITCAILRRGRPVMVEKPAALDFLDAASMAQAAEESGVPLLVNHVHLFAPAYEALRERVSAWSSFVTLSNGGGPGPVREYSPLWDYGAHDVAMFLGLLPEKMRTSFSARRGAVQSVRFGGGSRYGVRLFLPPHQGFFRVWNDGPKARFLIARKPEDTSLIDHLVYDDTQPQGRKLTRGGRAIPVSAEKPLTRALRVFAFAAKTGVTDWRFSPAFAAETTLVLERADAATRK